MSDETKRICLWSGPRNVSTALMYSFAQRADTKVFDEPLYAHYLANTDADTYHPGANEVLQSMENNGEKVVQMMLGSHEKSVVFFKNMTHHLLDLDKGFMKNVINVFLTRDPREMLPSFDKVIENPTMTDVGYQAHIDLLDYLDGHGVQYWVLDSKRILLNPEKVLSTLCDEIGIPFEEDMLKWTAGARPEDGVWAPYWYGNIHRSTGFQPYQPKTAPFPEHLNPLLESCMPLYERLLALAV